MTELSKKDFWFTILSFEKRDRFEKEKDVVESIIKKANITWMPLQFTSSPPLFSKIYDRRQMKRTALKLHKRERFDIVHCRSYIAAEVGLIFKKKLRTKFLFDMRGFWADEKVDNGQWNQKRFLYRLIYRHYKKREKEFLLNADGIVTLTQAAKDFLLSKTEYKDLSIEVIPCCVDLDHFDFHKISNEQKVFLRENLKIPVAAKVITYLGSIGGWYMTKEMFCYFKMLIDNHPEYVMLVLTKDDPQVVKKEALAAGIPVDKIITSYSNRSQLPQLLSLSDCGIFFIRNTFSKIASSPTKHAELMGMGIPVICNDIGDTGHIVISTKTGIVIRDFTNRSFQEVIKHMPILEKIDREYIRSCTTIFDLKAGVQEYMHLYKHIIS